MGKKLHFFVRKIDEKLENNSLNSKKHNKGYFFSFIVRKYDILLVESQKNICSLQYKLFF